MFQLLGAFCFLTNIIRIKCETNNELVRDDTQKNYKFQNKDLEWHEHSVADGEYAFVVSAIHIEKTIVTRYCSGSMIARTWVLSSAHCFYERMHKKYDIWYGNYTVSPLITNLYTKILDIFIHPFFKHADLIRPGYFFEDYDISLLRIQKIEGQSYARLSSVDNMKMTGLDVKYIGGVPRREEIRIDRRDSNLLKPLQVAEGVVVKCGMSLTLWSKYVLCVSPKCTEKSHPPIHGDTGGPFLYKGKIIGIMTLGFQIPKTSIASNGLTPIKPYKDWIHHIVHPKKKTTVL